jgi:cbb3-type cytochrome oxidase maturation protein
MNIIILLVLSSVVVAIAFLAAFLWSTATGQYDDIHTPAIRMLFDDRVIKSTEQEHGT